MIAFVYTIGSLSISLAVFFGTAWLCEWRNRYRFDVATELFLSLSNAVIVLTLLQYWFWAWT